MCKMTGTPIARPDRPSSTGDGVEIRQTGAGVAWISDDALTVPIELAAIAAIAFVSIATVRRWCRLRELPPIVAARLRTAVLGLFDHARWVGWSIDREGALWSPAGYSFMPPEIEQIGFQRQRNDALRVELDAARAELDAYAERERITRARRISVADVHAAGVSRRPSRRRRPSSGDSPV